MINPPELRQLLDVLRPTYVPVTVEHHEGGWGAIVETGGRCIELVCEESRISVYELTEGKRVPIRLPSNLTPTQLAETLLLMKT